MYFLKQVTKTSSNLSLCECGTIKWQKYIKIITFDLQWMHVYNYSNFMFYSSNSENFIFQREHIKVAQQFFQLVGSSASECDTIPGRQCMASSLFLQRQFDDVLLYLSSIKSYYFNDDSFNFNYAQVFPKMYLSYVSGTKFLTIILCKK